MESAATCSSILLWASFLSIFASYIFAMTVVPLYCATFIRIHHDEPHGEAVKTTYFTRIVKGFNDLFVKLLLFYDKWVQRALERPKRTVAIIAGGIAFVLAALFPFVGTSYFPRTDPGQFVIDVKAPTGTRLELTDTYIAKLEEDIRQVVSHDDLDMIVSNIGITPDLSAIYTTNSAMHTAFVQVSLKEEHKIGSYEYMERLRKKLAVDMPQLSLYFQAGGLVDSVVNQGLPAPRTRADGRARICLRRPRPAAHRAPGGPARWPSRSLSAAHRAAQAGAG